MIDLTERSGRKELLDGDNIPFKDIEQTMKELNAVNTLLGGHRITIDGVRSLIKNKNNFNICEIGCGGGDNLYAIEKYFSKQSTAITYTGIDLKQECIRFAQNQYRDLPVDWISSDYSKVIFTQKPDIIFSSLFCHHFSNEELIKILQWMKENSNYGFFINDLHRSNAAYYLIKWLTKFFSRSYLVKNDACISVARSFRRKDWKELLEKANISSFRINWRWAFRYLVIVKNG